MPVSIGAMARPGKPLRPIDSAASSRRRQSSYSVSTPHFAHSRSNIRAYRGSDRFHIVYGRSGPGPAFEKIENRIRDESAARREDVRITVAMLLASKNVAPLRTGC